MPASASPRPARPADYPAICRLVQSPRELFFVYPSGRWPFTVAQLEDLAQVRRDLTVLDHEGTVAAFANLYDLEPGRHAFIGNVVVAPGLRGRGLGRRLVEYMLSRVFVHHGLGEARLSVFSHNVPALLLYLDLGFQPYAAEVRRDHDYREVVLLHMRREAG